MLFIHCYQLKVHLKNKLNVLVLFPISSTGNLLNKNLACSGDFRKRKLDMLVLKARDIHDVNIIY